LLLEVLFSNFVIFGYIIEAGQPKRKKKRKRAVDDAARVFALATWDLCFSVCAWFFCICGSVADQV
jgi:hypothetical protein